MKKKTIKTTTLNALMAVSKTETGMDYVQVMPDDPRVGLVEPFRGLGYGQMLSTGLFEFMRNRIPRSQAETLLRLPHSTVSRCKDHTLRFTYIVKEEYVNDFGRWLAVEATQAVDFINKQPKMKKKYENSRQH